MNRNFLLKSLPKKTQDAFFSKAELSELNLSQIICAPGDPIRYLYFPADGFISILQSIDDNPPLEVGMVGREGFFGAEIALGAGEHAFGAMVQGAGSAWKITAKDFLQEIELSTEFKSIVHSYLATRITQLGLSCACEHFHEIGPRFAKWLLMSQDRAQSSTFLMTHEFISLMLGVRRVGITTVAADFRRRGIIQYHRGEIKILDRTALKAKACSCYQKNRKIYLSHIG